VYPLVVRAGGGSARDTLSVLDQLIAGAGDEGVTYERAAALLGVTDGGLLDEMCEAFAAADGAAVMEVVERVVEGGHDPRRFAGDLLERLRDLIVINQVPDAASSGLIEAPADQLSRMTSQATRMGTSTLTRMAEVVADGLAGMRGATAPRLLLELACVRAILPGSEESMAGLLQRLETLEQRGAAAPAMPATPPARPVERRAERRAERSAERPSDPPPEPSSAESGPPAAPSEAPAPAADPAAAPPAPEPAGDGVTAASIRRQWDRIMMAMKDRKKTTAAIL